MRDRTVKGTLFVLALLSGYWTLTGCSTTPVAPPPSKDSGYIVAYSRGRDTVTSPVQRLCSGYNVATGECAAAVVTLTGSISPIFAGDPKRPGAGYVTVSGAAYRILGESCSPGCDARILIHPGSYYYLRDAKENDFNSPVLDDAARADLTHWVNTWHAPDSK